ncbi:hypothetical protein EV702DRAFT_1047345 [Suillus placidus]|uniref:Uncharacterized protein n=1 Tax=Suillus placidus TaxID=48579 RepID=A0A9P7D0R6_9AGAM|nr:hypothetical protein EV702DRAFT_1047345 [Suillus placidus]
MSCSDCGQPDETASTQPRWIKDMMVHVESSCKPEFSTDGSGDDISVFWEPELSSFTDPFTAHHDLDSLGHTVAILSAPSPLRKFPTTPSSPPDSHSHHARSPTLPGATTHTTSHSPVPTTIPVDEDKRSHSQSHTRHEGAGAREQLARVISVPEAMRQKQYFWNASYTAFSVQPDKWEDSQSMVSVLVWARFVVLMRAPKGGASGEVVPVQASHTTGARQTRKRNISDVDSRDSGQENKYLNPAPVVKRICREKTGTDWQTVFDIIKYSEEQRNSGRGNEATA